MTLPLRRFAASDLAVGAIGLGCLSMSWAYGEPAARDDRESIRVIQSAIDGGVTVLDTADTYGPFTNETLIGRAIRDRRDRCQLVTKGGLVVHDDAFGMHRDGRPEHLRAAHHASLRRLGAEYVDIYMLHRVDRTVPVEESWGTLAQFVADGTTRAIGISEPTLDQLRRAHAVHPVAAIESELSLWARDPLTAVIPWCRVNGVGFLAFAPLGQGFLTGTVSEVAADDFRSANPRFSDSALSANQTLIRCIDRVAARRDASRAQVAIAWTLACGDHVVPIPGTRRLRHLQDNIGAAAVTLSPEDLVELDLMPEPFNGI